MGVKLILKSGDVEMRFPITPPSISMTVGRRALTYDLISVGEHTEYGSKTAEEYRLDDLLIPGDTLAYAYPSTIGSDDPQAYVKQLKAWMDDKSTVRLVTSGSPLKLNAATYITQVEATQRGGVGNVYLSVTLIDHAALKKQSASGSTTTTTTTTKRDSKSSGSGEKTYTVKSGDCLWSICKKYYQDGTLAYKLAAYNSIKNANYILAGQVIKLPEKEKLT